MGNQEDERRYFLDKGEFRHLKTVLQASPVPLKTWARMYECDLAELQQFLLGHCPPPAVFKTAMREKETEVPLGFWVLHAKKSIMARSQTSSTPFSGSANPIAVWSSSVRRSRYSRNASSP